MENRTIEALKLSFDLDILKNEDKIEKIINSNLDIDIKLKKLKKILTKMSLVELNKNKLEKMINYEHDTDNK